MYFQTFNESMKHSRDRNSTFRIPRSTLRRFLALVVAEAFLCSGVLPVWAGPFNFLRPRVTTESSLVDAVRKAADGGVHRKKRVLSFEDIQPDEKRWGRKGSRLAQMKQAGLPVPDGFVIDINTVQELRRNIQNAPSRLWIRKIPKTLWVQIQTQIRVLERRTGRRLGDPDHPLILAVRPGAAEALPGLLPTVIGVGLNDQTVHGLVQDIGEAAAYDAYLRFLRYYGVYVLEKDWVNFPDPPRESSVETLKTYVREYQNKIKQWGVNGSSLQDPWNQLVLCLCSVIDALNKREVQLFGKDQKILLQGVAIVIQQVVFGNINDGISGAGLLYTKDPQTGQGTSGRFLFRAQGEDLMSKNPDWFPTQQQFQTVYKRRGDELNEIASRIESLFHTPQAVELVIEKRNIYVVQTDDVRLTPLAKLVVRMKNKFDHTISIPPIPLMDPTAEILARGSPVGEGMIIGKLIFLDEVDEAKDLEQIFSALLKEREEKIIAVVPEVNEPIRRAVLREVIHGLVITNSRLALHDESLLRALGVPTLIGANVKKRRELKNVVLDTALYHGVLYEIHHRVITDIPYDVRIRRKKGTHSEQDGQIIYRFDYDKGIREMWVEHMSSMMEYLGSSPIELTNLYEYASAGEWLQQKIVEDELAKLGSVVIPALNDLLQNNPWLVRLVDEKIISTLVDDLTKRIDDLDLNEIRLLYLAGTYGERASYKRANHEYYSRLGINMNIYEYLNVLSRKLKKMMTPALTRLLSSESERSAFFVRSDILKIVKLIRPELQKRISSKELIAFEELFGQSAPDGGSKQKWLQLPSVRSFENPQSLKTIFYP